MDCSLKLDYINKELLVIVNHHVTVDLISDWYLLLVRHRK